LALKDQVVARYTNSYQAANPTVTFKQFSSLVSASLNTKLQSWVPSNLPTATDAYQAEWLAVFESFIATEVSGGAINTVGDEGIAVFGGIALEKILPTVQYITYLQPTPDGAEEVAKLTAAALSWFSSASF
jgi:hypothetical protein